MYADIVNRRNVVAAIVGFVLGVVLFGLPGCWNSAEQQDREAVDRQQRHYQDTQPLPWFDYSLERDVVIQLYQARQEKVATYTVWRGDTSVIEGHCPSVGYPIPYDTSMTNPFGPYYFPGGPASFPVEQAEPNGLFASKNSIATWVRCIYNLNGKAVEVPLYIESKVTAYPFPVKVNVETGEVVPAFDGTPSIVIEYDQ